MKFVGSLLFIYFYKDYSVGMIFENVGGFIVNEVPCLKVNLFQSFLWNNFEVFSVRNLFNFVELNVVFCFCYSSIGVCPHVFAI